MVNARLLFDSDKKRRHNYYNWEKARGHILLFLSSFTFTFYHSSARLLEKDSELLSRVYLLDFISIIIIIYLVIFVLQRLKQYHLPVIFVETTILDFCFIFFFLCFTSGSKSYFAVLKSISNFGKLSFCEDLVFRVLSRDFFPRHISWLLKWRHIYETEGNISEANENEHYCKLLTKDISWNVNTICNCRNLVTMTTKMETKLQANQCIRMIVLYLEYSDTGAMAAERSSLVGISLFSLRNTMVSKENYLPFRWNISLG